MLSKNEVAKLKSLRGKLAVLCPETDGLQAKYRIVYAPEGTTYIEQRTASFPRSDFSLATSFLLNTLFS